jgi:hypothetical protein
MAIGNESTSASATEIVIVTMGMDVNASGIAHTSLGAAICKPDYAEAARCSRMCSFAEIEHNLMQCIPSKLREI